MARILLVEPQAIVREGLALLLARRPDWDVVGEAADGPAALVLAQRLRPDLVLTEAYLPRLSGVELTSELSRDGTACVILAANRGSHLVRVTLEAGARAYVTKHSSPAELVKAVDIVLKGGTYLSPDVVLDVVDAFTGRESASQRSLSALSQRERQVLRLIADGLSSKEIAEAVGVSPRTVESYRATLMEKLGIRKVAGLVRFAIREGLVEP